LIAGLGLLAMSVLAGFANFGVVDKVTDPEDTATGLFRIAVLALVVVVVLDVLVAWALREFFAPVDPAVATLAAWCRLAYAAVFLVAIADLHAASGALDPLAHVDAFRDVWDVGLILFGVHLVLIGHLAARHLPAVLGALVAVAGLGYVVDGAGAVLVVGYAVDLAAFTFVGEVLLMLWLLVKARNTASG
jgi:hypothetical protein